MRAFPARGWVRLGGAWLGVARRGWGALSAQSRNESPLLSDIL